MTINVNICEIHKRLLETLEDGTIQECPECKKFREEAERKEAERIKKEKKKQIKIS